MGDNHNNNINNNNQNYEVNTNIANIRLMKREMYINPSNDKETYNAHKPIKPIKMSPKT